MKKAIVFYLLIPIIYLISFLPFKIIYFISDRLYFLVYKIIGYRKNVVITNLKNSFPQKSEMEILKISEDFYRFLCDYVLESIKSLSMTAVDVQKRCRFVDDSLIKKMYAQNCSIIGVLGHFGNWEWANPAFATTQQYQLHVIYKKLSNRYFDKFMYDIRAKFGTKLIESNNVVRAMVGNKNSLSATIFVGDQTPFPDQAYWTTFLNQDTAIFKGTEIMAKKLDLPVVYVSVKREKRGYYIIEIEMLCEHPKLTAEGEITRMHTTKLEQDILENPAIWLWSHRRWKHKNPNRK